MGGVQCYVSSKAEFLEKNEWNVKVMWDGMPDDSRIPFPCLRKFSDCYVPIFIMQPFSLPKFVVNRYIKMIACKFRGLYDEIVIESHSNNLSLWGELLASELRCRHIVFLTNEYYSAHREQINFYKYKLKRREVFGTYGLKQIFYDQPDIDLSNLVSFKFTESPILDIEAESVKKIDRLDYNICYLGRAQKKYVPNVLKGIEKFAVNHPNETINFVIVGDFTSRKSELITVKKCNNINVIELGDLVPIPAALYSKVDVVIAGSGCARHSCEYGALTIVADCINLQSAGLLGYENQNSMEVDEGRQCEPFEDTLERVLVQKVHLDLQFNFKSPPSIKECCEQHFQLIEKADCDLSYYSFNFITKGKIQWRKLLKLYLIYIYTKYGK